MPASTDLAKISQTAMACTATNTAEFTVLSSKMCWDAVLHVGMLAGVISEARHKAVLGTIRGDNPVLVTPSDPQVNGAAGLAAVPAGHAIYFFTKSADKDLAVHAMVSVGSGKACGNKNACIGVGGPVGWEVVDLAKANWSGDAIMRGSEQIVVRHRAITG